MYLTKSRLYRPEKNVMVRILSPIEFPVDWNNRMIKQSVIDKSKIKTKDLISFSSIKSKISTGVDGDAVKNLWQWC